MHQSHQSRASAEVFVRAREIRTSVIRADHIKIRERHPVVEGDASLAVAEAAWASRELRMVSIVLPLTVKVAGGQGRTIRSGRVMQQPCRDAVQLLVTYIPVRICRLVSGENNGREYTGEHTGMHSPANSW